MEKKFQIYGMGNALVDFEIETTPDQLKNLGITKGVMTLIDEELQDKLYTVLGKDAHTRACGGSAANTIIGAQSLGSVCFYSCKVAEDETGHFYKQDLLACGVESNLSYQALQPGKSGKCLVMITDDADRTMNTFLGITGDIDYSQINEAALAKSMYLYIEGYLAGSPIALTAAVQCMNFAKKNNVKTAFSLSDPNIVNFCGEGLAEIIGTGVDLLFCNEDEAKAYSKQDNLQDAISILSKLTETLVVTLGSEGSVVINNGQQIKVDGHNVKAVDTNGAGDLFAGAFLHALANGATLKSAGNLASFASAQLVTQFGPRLSRENLVVVKEFVNTNKI
jgi:sugar/nucleoside kinase (ribokinase family)